MTAVFVCAMLLGACTQASDSVYSRNDVGQIIETSHGTVLASRSVEIRDTNMGPFGTIGGGAAGGVIGSTIGSGSGKTLATLGGVLLGAGLGYLTERELRSGRGTEYLVEMDDGRTVTIVQNNSRGDEIIPDGSPVLVQYGGDYTRIVPVSARSGTAASGYPPVYGRSDPGGASPGTGTSGDDEWRNPDLLGSGDPNSPYRTGPPDDPDAPYDPRWSQNAQQ